MINPKRLYVFTGKGGVGKTTLALAMTKYLRDLGKNTSYIYFEKNVSTEIYHKLKISYEELELKNCVEGYMAKKLGSRVVASWINKTPFFNALLNMVPGFNYIIFLGYLLDEKIKQQEDHIVVLDSPSSGHAITMFEACFNFKEIFQSGALVDDINKMLDFIYRPELLKVIICSLPTMMAMGESFELEDHLKNLISRIQKLLLITQWGPLQILTWNKPRQLSVKN